MFKSCTAGKPLAIKRFYIRGAYRILPGVSRHPEAIRSKPKSVILSERKPRVEELVYQTDIVGNEAKL